MKRTIHKSDQAYDVIEDMIIFQDLLPGTIVSEAQLMSLTGVGRSPVREALQRLAADRVVEIIPYKGVMIPPLSLETQFKVLEIRRCLGEFAVSLAARRGTNNQKKEMALLAEKFQSIKNLSQIREFNSLLKQTYLLIGEACQNVYVQASLAPLQGLSSRFWYSHLTPSNETELEKVAMLNVEILRHICHGDEKLASEASKAINDYFIDFNYKLLKN